MANSAALTGGVEAWPGARLKNKIKLLRLPSNIVHNQKLIPSSATTGTSGNVATGAGHVLQGPRFTEQELKS
ncbi:hypothetical protein ACLKA6_001682 [Drosophila palustris]